MSGWWEADQVASPMDIALSAEGVSGQLADVARSIYHQESGSGRNTTTSNAGARGGMQVIPATFNRMADKGWNIDNPVDNARAGVRYIKRLGDLAGGDPALIAAGYYGGEGAIPKARQGIAVSDPRNPNAPNTLQYGQQVASRLPQSDWWANDPVAPAAAPAVPAETAPNPTEGISTGENMLAGAGKFLMDSARGLKQNLLDKPAAELERLMPWSADISRAIGGKTAAEIEAESRAQAIESKRLDAPLMGTKAGIAGNLLGALSTAPLAAPLGAVGGGALFGASTPTTDAGGGESLKNMAIGGAGGYVGDKLLKGVSRVIQPKVSPNVRTLIDEGITPTPGQIMGGNFAKLESKLTSVPILGDAIANAQQRAGAQLNTAAFNRALTPIGDKLPKGVTGNDAVEYVGQRLGQAYDDLLPKLTTQADTQFAQDIGSLRQMVQDSALDPKYSNLFERTVQARVLDKFQGQNAATGQTIKDIESYLGSEIKRFAQSQDPDARLLGDAFKQVQSNIRDLLERTNPQHAQELKAINSGWANFKRVQRASGAIGAEEGVFTPAQLQNAVKAMDRSKDKARFAEGNALMQDLSGAAKSVMGSKYPDSGTAGRAMNAGAIGAGLYNPAIPLSLFGGAGLYSPTAQKLIAGLLTSRSAGAGLLSDQVRSAAPYAGLLAAEGGLQLGN
jgi:hypothetical protein